MLVSTFLFCVVLYATCAETPTTMTLQQLLQFSSITNSGATASNCLEECECGSDADYYDPLTTNRTFGQSTTVGNSCTCQCCGIRMQQTGNRIIGEVTEDRILGATTTATHHEYPWIVAILKVKELMGHLTTNYKCVGSLIHRKVVLTVAHHVSGEDLNSFVIRAGGYDTENLDNQYDRKVSQSVVHERYNPRGFINDIALLFLVDEYVIGGNINLICLPPSNQNFDSERCLVSGWGKDAFDNYSSKLRTVELPIVPKNKCLTELKKAGMGQNFKLHDSIICAGGEIGVDTCQGDGGAPLVCPIANTINRYHQVGIVSWGVGCGGPPGGYVNVPLFINWIKAKLER